MLATRRGMIKKHGQIASRLFKEWSCDRVAKHFRPSAAPNISKPFDAISARRADDDQQKAALGRTLDCRSIAGYSCSSDRWLRVTLTRRKRWTVIEAVGLPERGVPNRAGASSPLPQISEWVALPQQGRGTIIMLYAESLNQKLCRCQRWHRPAVDGPALVKANAATCAAVPAFAT